MIINFFSIHNLLFVCKLVLVTLDQVIGVNCKQDHIVPYFTLNVTNMFAHISICFLLTITNTAICGSNTANIICPVRGVVSVTFYKQYQQTPPVYQS